MSEAIPEWALKRAAIIANSYDDSVWDAVSISRWSAGKAFALYIAAHEDPPADPLLIEAMAFTEARGWNGSSPDLPMVRFAHAAIHRGMELAREQGA